MRKAKKILWIIVYGIITLILAYFVYQKVTTYFYDALYRIQRHGEKTTKCTEADFMGLGIGKLDIAEEVYLAAEGKDGDNEDRHFLAMFQRLSSNDYVVKDRWVYRDNAYVYTTKNGEHALSEGVWQEVMRENENPGFSVEGMIGLVDLRTCVSDGYGTEIYEFLKENHDGSIRLDEYAQRDCVIYPIKMTLVDGRQNEVKVIHCNNSNDISDLLVMKETDVWLLSKDHITDNERIMKSFKSMEESDGSARKYADIISKDFNYKRDICEKGYYELSSKGVVNYIAFTYGDYGYIHVEVIRDFRITVIAGLVIMFVWLTNMIVFIIAGPWRY